MLDWLKRLYWDSNVFISLISSMNTPSANERRRNCELFFQDAIEGKAQIFTSTLTIVEVRYPEELLPDRVPQQVRQKITDLFNEPYITLIPIDPARAIEARELVWGYPWLRTADAIQIASAIFAGVDEMHTYDGQGRSRGILHLNGLIGSPSLKIVVPLYEGQPRMT